MTLPADVEEISRARFALYFCPNPGTALWHFGSTWLGRNIQEHTDQAEPRFEALNEILNTGECEGFALDAIVKLPRYYGFHATLKPPFYLKKSKTLDELMAAVQNFASESRTCVLPPLIARSLGHFVALVPETTSPRVDAFARNCVVYFDDFRALPSEAEVERRLKTQWTPRQQALLAQWGYPFVMEEFRFHMTLTGKLPADVQAHLIHQLSEPVTELNQVPHVIDTLCLCYQPQEGADFKVFARFQLNGS
ncbi:MAG: DUF1045 domain-containing protein [Gammaproteobacteria bacterium]|nr:DUF1045 domain-containing protein [Gammaproteobacteria bacterium]